MDESPVNYKPRVSLGFRFHAPNDPATLIQSAYTFAVAAHFGQTRKYTGEPYVNHPVRVAQRLYDLEFSTDVVCAGLLHDVVEDTPVTEELIREVFGRKVADYVAEVTKVTRRSDGPRRERHLTELKHLVHSSYEGASVKLADILENLDGIANADSQFARIYLLEKKDEIQALRHGPSLLYRQACESLIREQSILKTIPVLPPNP